ncbi:possible outer membrane protein [Oceanicola granulosus HTCC2516]|uniref:Possible outer membrane protein n=1 Tax=Oceanicola granulosus (strain ATCC BAA-861 / DSM 15982 / KCTC 12143 / HTCC2516) TaxID=314256 RepID=Q2CCZ6_OCEGH|nr:outer membrane beta-barrel protein [Oceanicola granulosus]EAR50580.1 possible outer membrane protein [Oceanicola granulosus HTCC2516]
MKTLAVTALASLAAAPAFAGGLDTTAPQPVLTSPAPAPAPVTMATRDWSGAYGGVQLGYGQTDGDVFAEEEEGALYGGFVGYQRDFGSIVAGAELDYLGTDITNDATGTDIDSLARAKLRVGYDAGNFLPYATGGYAMANTSGGLEADADGYFYGVGADYMVTDRIAVGGEITKNEFEDFDGSGDDFGMTTASARVSFRF